MRLLARVYADSNTPSKVSVLTMSLQIRISINYMTVVAKFHEAQIHGQITVVAYHRYFTRKCTCLQSDSTHSLDPICKG